MAKRIRIYPRGINPQSRPRRSVYEADGEVIGGVQPPWRGTKFEGPLRELTPRNEPYQSDPESFWNLVYGMVLAISRDAKRKPEGTYGRSMAQSARWLGKRGAAARRKADASFLEGKRQAGKLLNLEADRLQIEARITRQINAELLRGWKNDKSVRRSNRPPDDSSYRIVQLLGVVRQVTGRPHHATVAQLLTLAGKPMTADALKKIERRFRNAVI